MARFEVVEETDDEAPAANQRSSIPNETLDTILLGIKTLPKKTALALSNCFALITVASVFWLAMLIIPYEPNTFQLAGLAGYALFVIAVNIITRKS
jgi:hypothetical protein